MKMTAISKSGPQAISQHVKSNEMTAEERGVLLSQMLFYTRNNETRLQLAQEIIASGPVDFHYFNSADIAGLPALFHVVRHNNRFDHRMVILLIENGADINFVISHGNTALHYAAGFYNRHYEEKWYGPGSIEGYKTLISLGTDDTLTNEYGETPKGLYSYAFLADSIISASASLPPGPPEQSNFNRQGSVNRSRISSSELYEKDMASYKERAKTMIMVPYR